MLKHDDEIAQIDHLILFEKGVFIIESKSCLGEISYNEQDEWKRKTGTYYSGFKSPIKQAQRQMDILSALITKNAGDIFKSYFFRKAENIKFNAKEFGQEILVAIDDKAILNRENNTKINDNYVMKADAVCAHIEKRLDKYNFSWTSLISRKEESIVEMSPETLDRLSSFLLETDKKTRLSKSEKRQETKEINNKKACKSCSQTEHLEIKYGRYSYYFFCIYCNQNTSIKEKCPDCGNPKTRIKKFKKQFYLDCDKCGHNSLYHTNK